MDYVVLGPRQVGKTTLLPQLADEILDREYPPGNLTYFDFADERLVSSVSPRDVVAACPPAIVADRPRVFLLDDRRPPCSIHSHQLRGQCPPRGWDRVRTGQMGRGCSGGALLRRIPAPGIGDGRATTGARRARAPVLETEPLRFNAGDLANGDRCGWRMIRQIYEAFEFNEDALPPEFDKELGILVLPD